MKFNCIEKEIEKCLEIVKPLKANDLTGTLHAQYTNEYDRAVIMALRKNQVNLTQFIQVALWEWEYILNKMADMLPRYIQENLNGYEIKEEEEV